MEYDNHEQEDEVYGGEIPVDADMDADVPYEQEVPNPKDLEDMKNRLKEIEEEAGALREMQAKVEKEMGAAQDSTGDASQAEKEEVDSRSIYVGNVSFYVCSSTKGSHFVNEVPDGAELFYSHYQKKLCLLCPIKEFKVDYACTPEEVQQHFQSCGTVNRVTILTDKFGQPKGFAYVEFVEVEAVQNAILLNESELHGRQLKVSAKRTNVPGMKQYRGRRPSPYYGFGPRMPYMPAPFYPSYGYGRVPRYRRPMRYRPY